MLKDMMPHFDLFQPASLDDALDLADRLGDGGWPLAGGLDSLNSFKDRSKQIEAAIDLAGIAAGALRFPFRKFLLACFAGRLPRSFIEAYLGWWILPHLFH